MEAISQIGRSYLTLQTQIENGGVIGVVINNIEFKDNQFDLSKLQNISLWTSYLNEFLLNSSRLRANFQNNSKQPNNWTSINNPSYGSTIMMIIWLMTFIILIVVIIVIMIRQCMADKRTRSGTCNHSRTIQSNRRNRVIIIVSMCLMIVLWLIFMILLCLSQHQVSIKLANNTSNPAGNSTTKNGSLKDAVSSSFNYLNNFFDIITNQTTFFLMSSIASVSQDTKNQLKNSVVEFGNQVLTTFNITTLLSTAQMLVDNINKVVTSMIFIKEYCQKILVEVDNMKGSVNVYKNNLISYLNNICPTLKDNSLLYTCRIIQAQINIFAVNTQTDLVSSSSSVIMLFVLQQYNINISNIMTSVVQVNSDFQTKLNSLYNTTVNQFDVTSYLAFIPTAWANLVGSIGPSLKNTSTYSSTVNSYLDTASKYEYFFIIIIFLLILMTFAVLISSFRDSLQRKFLNRCLSCFVQLAFIVSLILSALVCIAMLILVNFSQSEICNQVSTNSGITVLDKMFNDKIDTPWNSFTRSAFTSVQNFDFSLAPPNNILSGIKDGCRNADVGLLSVLGIKNIVNISNIIRSNDIMTTVTKAKADSLKAFLDVNPQQIIPQDIMSFVGQTLKLVSYFDEVNYMEGIQELQKPLVGILDYHSFISGLTIFALNASKSIGWTSDLKYFNDTINQLQTMSSNLTNLQPKVSNLTTQFQILQMYRNNTYLLKQLMTTITNVLALFKDSPRMTSMFSAMYDDFIGVRLLNVVEKVITNGINNVLGQIFPCGDLARIYDSIITSICSKSNLNDVIATMAVTLLVEIIFCQVIAIIIITSISMRFNCKNISDDFSFIRD